MLEANPDDLELAEGRFAIRGNPSHAVSWGDIAKLANHRPAKLPPGVDPGLDALRKYMANEWGSFASAVHIVEVEIDVDTGITSILRYVVVEDCGTVVNPTGVEAQIQQHAVDLRTEIDKAARELTAATA